MEPDADGRWPFHSFVEQLILDMFDPGKVQALVLYAFYFVSHSLNPSKVDLSSDNMVSMGDPSWQCNGSERNINASWWFCWSVNSRV